jgi:hypothetical protein
MVKNKKSEGRKEELKEESAEKKDISKTCPQ